jgi:hypothetical protein
MTRTLLSRRYLLQSLGLGTLGAVGALATGCPRTRGASLADGGSGSASASPTPLAPTLAIDDGDAPPPLVCSSPTADNIEGPFYKAGAPWRASISDGARGLMMGIGGAVLGSDCTPIAGATLDVWQADGTGEYDHTGWTLRGRLTSDRLGRWHVNSVVPGNYLNGSRYRPRHVHVKLAAAGYRPLTTQLYFPGDPYNQGDSWFEPSLVIAPDGPSRDTPGFWGTFDFVLESA